MKVLVTGAEGFIGKNLCLTLKTRGHEVLSYTKEDSDDLLNKYASICDFVVHLAGINRPKHVDEFYEGNVNFTEYLCDVLSKHENKVPILVSSSIHAEGESDYGKSKREGEAVLLKYQTEETPVYIYRLSNVYGKWSQPNYNSVIATWCYHIAHDLDVSIHDPSVTIPFVYIDDVVRAFVDTIEGKIETSNDGYYEVTPIDVVSLKEVYELLLSFKASQTNLEVPNLKTHFSKNLYSTYLSFIPKESLIYDLVMHEDQRGSFTEFLKSDTHGQVSVNISKPGITKGQHWHHSKNEKFLVVKGVGVIQMRHMITQETFEFKVSGDRLQVVDIPTGYTHNIVNTGSDDMITIMWVNEIYDPNNPDTYYEEV